MVVDAACGKIEGRKQPLYICLPKTAQEISPHVERNDQATDLRAIRKALLA